MTVNRVSQVESLSFTDDELRHNIKMNIEKNKKKQKTTPKKNKKTIFLSIEF